MERITYLILRLLRDEIEPAEQAELEAWLEQDPEGRAMLIRLQDPTFVATAISKFDQLHGAEALQRYMEHADTQRQGGRHRSHKRIGVRWAVAAAAIGLLGLGTWWLVSPKPTAPTAVVVTKAADIPAPATNKATLTLASGQHIVLDSAGNGLLARQGGAQIQKTSNGLLAYVPAATGASAAPTGPVLYNTLSNPRGSRVINLTLLDGTKVWLNAQSSITYPASFDAASRRVTMTGEAYFEVAKDQARPFIVRLPALGKGNREDGSWMDVEVLGTAFNINAYGDEGAARTTLVEGSVKVSASGMKKIIQPGEETAVSFGGPITVNPHADIERTLAWKNGRFSFAHSDLQEVMRQLSRWYDVDVSYEGDIPERHFAGSIGRTLTLDQVLRVLTSTRVHYTILPGNKLVIKP